MFLSISKWRRIEIWQGYTNFYQPLCKLRICDFKELCWVYDLSQSRQGYGLMPKGNDDTGKIRKIDINLPVWTGLCWLRLRSVANPLLHVSHRNGHSLLWEYMCFLKSPGVRNALEHWLQGCRRSYFKGITISLKLSEKNWIWTLFILGNLFIIHILMFNSIWRLLIPTSTYICVTIKVKDQVWSSSEFLMTEFTPKRSLASVNALVSVSGALGWEGLVAISAWIGTFPSMTANMSYEQRGSVKLLPAIITFMNSFLSTVRLFWLWNRWWFARRSEFALILSFSNSFFLSTLRHASRFMRIQWSGEMHRYWPLN